MQIIPVVKHCSSQTSYQINDLAVLVQNMWLFQLLILRHLVGKKENVLSFWFSQLVSVLFVFCFLEAEETHFGTAQHHVIKSW